MRESSEKHSLKVQGLDSYEGKYSFWWMKVNSEYAAAKCWQFYAYELVFDIYFLVSASQLTCPIQPISCLLTWRQLSVQVNVTVQVRYTHGNNGREKRTSYLFGLKVQINLISFSIQSVNFWPIDEITETWLKPTRRNSWLLLMKMWN